MELTTDLTLLGFVLTIVGLVLTLIGILLTCVIAYNNFQQLIDRQQKRREQRRAEQKRQDLLKRKNFDATDAIKKGKSSNVDGVQEDIRA